MSNRIGTFALVLIAACATANQPATPGHAPDAVRRAPVLVIAFDGFARKYLDQDSVPTFRALARDGVTGEAMIPSFPSVTFPNFYTLATGLYPDHTGIVNNSFYDTAFKATFVYTQPIAKEGRWWGGEPIWNTAARQGLRSATMFWVGSEAPVGGRQPDYWMNFDAKFPFESRVAQVLAWLDLPDSLRPALIMVYFQEPDHTGHEFGPDAPQTAAMVLRVDSMLAMLVNGLKARGLYDKANVVLVADHGMAATSPERVIYLDDAVDSASVRVLNTGPFLMIEAKDGDNTALLAKLRMLPHLRVWPKDSIPARLHYGTNARITAVVGSPDAGWLIVWRHGRPVTAGGQHGYDNADPSMKALFIAHGPAFKPGTTLAPFPNVDLYDLLAKLLGIEPAKNDGAITPFLPVLR